jgi:hypothetical protein
MHDQLHSMVLCIVCSFPSTHTNDQSFAIMIDLS